LYKALTLRIRKLLLRCHTCVCIRVISYPDIGILQDEVRESELKERAQQLLNTYQAESAPGANKRIVRTGGGVRVTGNTSPKPNIHIVQKATLVKPSVTSSASDSAQVDEVLKQENNSDNLSQESDDSKKDVDDVKKDSDGKENEKESDRKENDTKTSVKQAAAEPRQKHRRKRHGLPAAKPVSKVPSELALRMADKPPVEKRPIKPVNSAPVLSLFPVRVEDTEDSSETVKAERDGVSTTPVIRSESQSPDSMQVSVVVCVLCCVVSDPKY